MCSRTPTPLDGNVLRAAGAMLLVLCFDVGCAVLTSKCDEVSNCHRDTDCGCIEYCHIQEDCVRTCTAGCQSDADCPGDGEYFDERCDRNDHPQQCVAGECRPACEEGRRRCGTECCASETAVCLHDVCCESGAVCGEICCVTQDSCCVARASQMFPQTDATTPGPCPSHPGERDVHPF